LIAVPFASSKEMLLRGQLQTVAKPAAPFVKQCLKLQLSYCDVWESNAGLRDFLAHSLLPLAQAHPSVEFIVKKIPFHHPHVTGIYSGSFASVAMSIHPIRSQTTAGTRRSVCGTSSRTK
jgi:hypothetical protein